MEDDTLTPLILPLDAIDASMLSQVGGKAANLGELARAGLPVPPGFCITTTAYTRATSSFELEPLLEQLATIPADASTQHHVAGKLLGDRATPDELQTILRGLPYNVTTKMDLKRWKLSQQIREDTSAAHILLETLLDLLAQKYHAETLPATLQQGLAHFLHTYGHRGVAEIDTSLPRWSEDPTHILGMLVNYLQLDKPELAPDAQFQRGYRSTYRNACFGGRGQCKSSCDY
jgi:pyruvate,water dikinase